MPQDLIDQLYENSNKGNLTEIKSNIDLYKEFYQLLMRNPLIKDEMYPILETIIKKHE